MLTRCSITRIGRVPSLLSTPARTVTRNAIRRQPARRNASSAAPKAGASGSTSHGISPLIGLSDELTRIAPKFDVDADDVQILRGPAEFYSVLKDMILNAESRIYLSTLYIGKTEHELISTLQAALRNNESLKLFILCDALRGTRETPEPTTASLLSPLITEFGQERVRVRMYHTPNLTGIRKRIIPKRINEGWGLQHMKLYGVDDEIILSGANLSNDYFTNRLDRYHLFRSKALTDYFYRIHVAVSSISFDVQPSDSNDQAGYTLSWPTEAQVASPLEDPKAYRSHAAEMLSLLIKRSSSSVPAVDSLEAGHTTTVYPIFQLTPFFKEITDASTELPALTLLLNSLRNHATRTTFTAGYFNPSRSLVSLLLSAYDSPTTPTSKSTNSKSSTTVIAASPWANGFYGSKGISGLLPPAYTLLCRRFLEEVLRRGLSDKVKLLEWRKGTVGEAGGWTYHAKGVWVTLLDQHRRSQADAVTEGNGEAGPSITLIGSSNYTQRSYTLDLEANALVLTRDPGLQRRLREEEERLRADAKEVGLEEYVKTERRVGLHVRVAMWITKVVGGAL